MFNFLKVLQISEIIEGLIANTMQFQIKKKNISKGHKYYLKYLICTDFRIRPKHNKNLVTIVHMNYYSAYNSFIYLINICNSHK